MSTIEAPPDLAEVTARQRQVWSTGDYTVIATLVHPVSETLVDAADLHAGWRVLDVATGSGNAALAAARLGSDVTGIDYVPALLDRARERAAAERLDVRLAEADAHSLPFGDGEFDAVTSVFGVMFAADPTRAARELGRTARRKSSTTDLYRLMMVVRISDETVDLQGRDVRRQALSRPVQACVGAVSTPRIHPEYLA